MLKRSKTDEETSLVGVSGAVLVVNDDADAGELVARLVETLGLPAVRLTDLSAVKASLDDVNFVGVVIDSLSCGIEAAFNALEAIRGSAQPDTAVVVLASTDTNRLFAFQSGADAFVVRPFHSDDFLEEVRAVLMRSVDERADYRRAQLMGGAATA